MPVELNHTIVNCTDKQASAQFLVDILGLPQPTTYGPFVVVQVANGVSLDYADDHGEVHPQHYAFMVSDDEFDQILARIVDRGLTYWADPSHRTENQINTNDGGRGLYWSDPDGHNLEIITVPYGGEDDDRRSSGGGRVGDLLGGPVLRAHRPDRPHRRDPRLLRGLPVGDRPPFADLAAGPGRTRRTLSRRDSCGERILVTAVPAAALVLNPWAVPSGPRLFGAGSARAPVVDRSGPCAHLARPLPPTCRLRCRHGRGFRTGRPPTDDDTWYIDHWPTRLPWRSPSPSWRWLSRSAYGPLGRRRSFPRAVSRRPFGVASIVYPRHAGYIGEEWGVAVLAWAVVGLGATAWRPVARESRNRAARPTHSTPITPMSD